MNHFKTLNLKLNLVPIFLKSKAWKLLHYNETQLGTITFNFSLLERRSKAYYHYEKYQFSEFHRSALSRHSRPELLLNDIPFLVKGRMGQVLDEM